MYNLIKDLSTTTCIPVSVLNRVSGISNLLVCDDVLKSLQSGEQICQIDIGLGTLAIAVIDDTIKYKFIPSKVLDMKLKDTINSGESQLKTSLEQSLADKLVKAYKDLF